MTPTTKQPSLDIVKPMTAAELNNGQPVREFIMIAGKDGTGKTCDLVSICVWVQSVSPDATVYVIDTENKFKGAVKSFGADAPTNFIYYKCDNMNQVTYVVTEILKKYRPGDWVLTESLSRIWERAQNLGYEAVAGVSKIEYLSRKAGEETPTGVVKKNSPIPRPDDFWAVVKGAHDSAFFDLLTQKDDLNCVFTTTVAKAKGGQDGQRENLDRKALRVELGIDANLEGAPRLPYYVETLCMMEMVGGVATCRILRDNLSANEESRIDFPVPDKKSFAAQFFANCR